MATYDPSVEPAPLKDKERDSRDIKPNMIVGQPLKNLKKSLSKFTDIVAWQMTRTGKI
jgi:hypothetical protein